MKIFFMRMCIVEFLVLTCTMFKVFKRATNEHGGGEAGEIQKYEQWNKFP